MVGADGMGDGSERARGGAGVVVAEEGEAGLGFHLWFPSLLCLSIFNSSDHEQRLFYKLNLHRRCD